MSTTGRDQFHVGDVVNGYRWNGSTWEALPAHAMTDHMAREATQGQPAQRRWWHRARPEPERIPARPFGRVSTPQPQAPAPPPPSKLWIWVALATAAIAIAGLAAFLSQPGQPEPQGTSVTVGQVEYSVLAASDVTADLTGHPAFPESANVGRYIEVRLRVSSNRPGASAFSCQEFIIELEEGRSATCRAVADGGLGFVPETFELQTGQSQLFTLYYGIDKDAVINGVRVNTVAGRSDLVTLKV